MALNWGNSTTITDDCAPPTEEVTGQLWPRGGDKHPGDLDASTLTKSSQAEAEAGTEDTHYMTPLKTAEAIAALAPVGATGPQGPQGETGAAGADGSDGATGPAGADGSDGVGVPAGGTTGQVLAKGSNTDYDTLWQDETGGGVTSVTGTDPIASSGGSTPAISIAAASGTSDGSMSSADFTKLAGIEAGATANSSDATLLDRANHTGTQAQSTVTNLVTDLAAKADDSAVAKLTGAQTIAGVKTFSSSPIVPTPSGGTDATNKNYVDNAVTGLLDFKGSTDASANPNYPSASKGDAYVVSVAGKVGGASGASVDVGDVYLATADNAGGTQASVGASWTVLEHNIVGALLSANNLSDLANTSTARTNLGLGTASTLNVPASGNAASGEVVKGNDGRLSDSRTPSAHASSHASAGSDPVTLAQSQITNLTTDLAAKRAIAPRVNGTTSSSAPTPDADTTDMYELTALATAPTFGAPSGTPVDGQKLLIRILDNGTARAITWNAIYRALGAALPTTTTVSKTMYVGFIYNSAATSWDCVAMTVQA